MTEGPVRVGVLADPTVREWERRALNEMVEAGAEIDTVIINDQAASNVVSAFKRDPAYALIAGSRELSVKILGSVEALKKIEIRDIDVLNNSDFVSCKPIQTTDSGSRLPKHIIQKYCKSVDVLVRFGFGIIKGEVLSAPQYGVLSYHHGDITAYRGRPAGFWEFMHEEETMGVTLQQLTADLDAGKIVDMRHFPIRDNDTYQDVLKRAYLGSVDMLATAIIEIQQSTFEPKPPEPIGEIYYAPGWTVTAQYVLRNTARRARKWKGK